METWDALRSRRNVRAFLDRPIPAEHLDRILEAGRRTPSSRNEQPWDFVVATERDRLEALAKVWQGARHVATSAVTIAVVAPVPTSGRDRELLQYDLGQVTTSLMLAAIDLGIGAGHAYVDDRDLAGKLLGLPEDRFCAWLIALGYPSDRPPAPIRHPKRRAFDDVVHREHW